MGLAFLITGDQLQLMGERKVLKESEYAAVLTATEVVDTARREAQAMQEKARREAQAEREAGYREGAMKARQEYAQRLLSLAATNEQQLRALRSTMAQVVVKAMTQLLSESDPQQLYKAALLRVHAVLSVEPFVTVRVSPGREAALRQTLTELGRQAEWAARTLVTADASLPDGACILQTASGTIDLGVDAQIEAFRRVIDESTRAVTAKGPKEAAA